MLDLASAIKLNRFFPIGLVVPAEGEDCWPGRFIRSFKELELLAVGSYGAPVSCGRFELAVLRRPRTKHPPPASRKPKLKVA